MSAVSVFILYFVSSLILLANAYNDNNDNNNTLPTTSIALDICTASFTLQIMDASDSSVSNIENDFILQDNLIDLLHERFYALISNSFVYNANQYTNNIYRSFAIYIIDIGDIITFQTCVSVSEIQQMIDNIITSNAHEVTAFLESELPEYTIAMDAIIYSSSSTSSPPPSPYSSTQIKSNVVYIDDSDNGDLLTAKVIYTAIIAFAVIIIVIMMLLFCIYGLKQQTERKVLNVLQQLHVKNGTLVLPTQSKSKDTGNTNEVDDDLDPSKISAIHANSELAPLSAVTNTFDNDYNIIPNTSNSALNSNNNNNNNGIHNYNIHRSAPRNVIASNSINSKSSAHNPLNINAFIPSRQSFNPQQSIDSKCSQQSNHSNTNSNHNYAAQNHRQIHRKSFVAGSYASKSVNSHNHRMRMQSKSVAVLPASQSLRCVIRGTANERKLKMEQQINISRIHRASINSNAHSVMSSNQSVQNNGNNSGINENQSEILKLHFADSDKSLQLRNNQSIASERSQRNIDINRWNSENSMNVTDSDSESSGGCNVSHVMDTPTTTTATMPMNGNHLKIIINPNRTLRDQNNSNMSNNGSVTVGYNDGGDVDDGDNDDDDVVGDGNDSDRTESNQTEDDDKLSMLALKNQSSCSMPVFNHLSISTQSFQPQY